jgi:hypothetical protein
VTIKPEPATVGRRAARIIDLVRSSEEFARLKDSTEKYPDCWATFTGYPIIARFDLATDAGPLMDEALRVLCLKTAMFELTDGDESAAELVVSAPVDEMVHAVLAQYTLCQTMTERLGIRFVHMTDRERFGWEPGDYTHQCYVAAGWGEPNPRYWISKAETSRRLGILTGLYESIGIHDGGRSHEIDFTQLALVAS